MAITGTSVDPTTGAIIGGVSGTGFNLGGLAGGFMDALSNALGPLAGGVSGSGTVSYEQPVYQQQAWAPMPGSPWPNIDIPNPQQILGAQPGPLQRISPDMLFAQANTNQAYDSPIGGGAAIPTPTANPSERLDYSPMQPRPQQTRVERNPLADLREPSYSLDDVPEFLQPTRQSSPPLAPGVRQQYRQDPLDEAYAYDQQHGAGAYERSRGLPPPGALPAQNQPQGPSFMDRFRQNVNQLANSLDPQGAYQNNYRRYAQAVQQERERGRQFEEDKYRYEKQADYDKEMDKQRLVNSGNLQTKMAELVSAGRTLKAADWFKQMNDAMENGGPESSAVKNLALAGVANGFIAPDDNRSASPLGITLSDIMSGHQDNTKYQEMVGKVLDNSGKAQQNALDAATMIDKIQKQRAETAQQVAAAQYATQNAASQSASNTYKSIEDLLGLNKNIQTMAAQVQQPYLQNQATQQGMAATQLGMANTQQAMGLRPQQAVIDAVAKNPMLLNDHATAQLYKQVLGSMAGYQPGQMEPPPQQQGESPKAYQARVAAFQLPQAPVTQPGMPAYPNIYGGPGPMPLQGGVMQNGVPAGMVPAPPPNPPLYGASMQGQPQMMPQQYQQQQAMPQPQQVAQQPAPPVQHVPFTPGTKPDNFFPTLGKAFQAAGKGWSDVTQKEADRYRLNQRITEVEINENTDKALKAMSPKVLGLPQQATLTDPQVKEMILSKAGGDVRVFNAYLKHAGYGDVDWQDNTKQMIKPKEALASKKAPVKAQAKPEAGAMPTYGLLDLPPGGNYKLLDSASGAAMPTLGIIGR